MANAMPWTLGDVHIGGLPHTVFADVNFACMDLLQQNRPLVLGEGSGCAQNDG